MNLMRSKAIAWGALVLIVLVIVLTYGLRVAWWSFFDIFFAFMMVFCHLVACYTGNKYASRKLDVIAAVFGGLAVVSLLVEFVVWQIVMA